MKPNNLKKHQDNGGSPPPPRKPNWQNRTLFHKDNLEVMRGMNSETVDLIATDPPFNKSRDFHTEPDKLGGQGSRFQDRWSWEKDIHEDWSDQIKNDYPKLMEAIECARSAHSDGMGAFMCYMSVRLLEMRRLLKPTGSIFLHCDPTASHYLKTVLDAIFGRKNFQNEIIWCYTDPAGRKNSRYYKTTHDIIFWYVKESKHYKTNRMFMAELTKSTIKRYDKYFDVNGQITYASLKKTNPGVFSALKGIPDNLNDVWLDKNKGTVAGDWWNDIIPIRRKGKGQKAKEPYRYATQKPLKLYTRLIETATEPNDIVLDPFCGCATTCVAAERENRQWVGIDIWDGAHELVLDRIKEEGLSQEGEEDVFALFKERFQYRTDIPVRDDDGEVSGPNQAAMWTEPKAKWQRLTNSQMKALLVEWQTDATSGNVVCAGCGRILEKEFMEIDHIQPRSDGGFNFIDNRILLCRPCNGKKSNSLTYSGLIKQNKKDGWMQDHVKATWAKNKVKHGVSALQRDMYDPFLQ